MQEVICETITLIKFGRHPGGFRIPSGGGIPQNETFVLPNVESGNSQCRKVFMRQLFWTNLGVFRGKEPPKWHPQIETFEPLNKLKLTM